MYKVELISITIFLGYHLLHRSPPEWLWSPLQGSYFHLCSSRLPWLSTGIPDGDGSENKLLWNQKRVVIFALLGSRLDSTLHPKCQKQFGYCGFVVAVVLYGQSHQIYAAYLITNYTTVLNRRCNFPSVFVLALHKRSDCFLLLDYHN